MNEVSDSIFWVSKHTTQNKLDLNNVSKNKKCKHKLNILRVGSKKQYNYNNIQNTLISLAFIHMSMSRSWVYVSINKASLIQWRASGGPDRVVWAVFSVWLWKHQFKLFAVEAERNFLPSVFSMSWFYCSCCDCLIVRWRKSSVKWDEMRQRFDFLNWSNKLMQLINESKSSMSHLSVNMQVHHLSSRGQCFGWTLPAGLGVWCAGRVQSAGFIF